MNVSPAALIHHQRGGEDAALEAETETGGEQKQQSVPVPGRAQRGEAGHHQGVEQRGRELGQPLRHLGELETRDNDQSGYLMPPRLTWRVSSHSGRLITHFPMIVFLIRT